MRLNSYTGDEIPVCGKREVLTKYKGQHQRLREGEGPSLFGRDWLQVLRLDWQSINCVQSGKLDTVLQRHRVMFSGGLTLKGFEASICVDPNAVLRFCKARSIPYAMREKVEVELQCLVDEGILEPVQFANWASPR